MSSMQERLQLKRVPLDTWNIREQLCLASAVVRSGDQNWMSVSRALKTVGEPNRPQDWYSQKSCAAQYGTLLENVETPKRKKRNSDGAVESPQESILKKLTQERIVEIQKTIAEMNQQYEQLKTEITEVRNPATSDDRLCEVWTNIESSRRAKERETARVTAWLQEREERRARAERQWRPPAPTSPNNQVASTPAPPSSPLLTSLLKSSPVVTTPQHITHPANVVESVSPSVTAPTLSMLLEKSAASAQHESKHAAIEHIKSQLVQIEHQLKANTPPPVALPPTPPVPVTPAVDIDDIEIKAEDVYAFRDVDIHIQPVAAMHKGNIRVIDKPLKKDEMEIDVTTIPEPDVDPAPVDVVKEEPAEPEQPLTVETEVVPEIQPPPEEPVVAPEVPQVAQAPQEVEVKIAFPEVKFPTTEIKVIQPEVPKVKEEIKEPEAPIPEPVAELKEAAVQNIPQEETTPVVDEAVTLPTEQPTTPEPTPEPQPIEEPQPAEEEPPEVEQAQDTETIPLPPDPEPEPIAVTVDETPVSPELEMIPEQKEIKQEIKEEVHEEETPEADEDEDKTLDEIKKDEEAEDSIPLQAMVGEEALPRREEVKPHAQPHPHPHSHPHPLGHLQRDDGHTETDDDTPMELSREEEKDGKKRRDYSRKKKSDSRTCSGSESAAEASAPESPSGTDAERQHRLWKKSVMLVYSRLCAHKYASVFVRPISDEEAPGYSCVVKRPMDLHTIRRNIDAGAIRTTAEFQRDVLLMLSNALMYNSSEHSVYSMAKDLHEEARCQLGMLVAAQAHAGLVAPPPARRKRRRPDSPAIDHIHKRHA